MLCLRINTRFFLVNQKPFRPVNAFEIGERYSVRFLDLRYTHLVFISGRSLSVFWLRINTKFFLLNKRKSDLNGFEICESW